MFSPTTDVLRRSGDRIRQHVLVPTTIDFQLTIPIPVCCCVPDVVPDGIGGRPTGKEQTGRHRTRHSGSRFRAENPTAIQQTIVRDPFSPSTTTTTTVIPNSPATTVLRAALPESTTAILHATIPDPTTTVLDPTLSDGFRLQRSTVLHHQSQLLPW